MCLFYKLGEGVNFCYKVKEEQVASDETLSTPPCCAHPSPKPSAASPEQSLSSRPTLNSF